MGIKVIAFGNLAEITGKEIFVEVEDVDSLMADLKTKYPLLQERKILLAVNQRVVKENVGLNANDIVALMPPYSGG